ncbi:MAG: hypothetical protein RL761_922 [Pseudomonadota bacterium]
MLSAKNLKNVTTAIIFAFAASAAVQAADTSKTSMSGKITGEDDVEFLFVDKCKSGKPYRLKVYKIEVNGESIQMYDFDGPRGKGTIASDVEPRQAKALLCFEDKSAWKSSGRQTYN